MFAAKGTMFRNLMDEFTAKEKVVSIEYLTETAFALAKPLLSKKYATKVTNMVDRLKEWYDFDEEQNSRMSSTDSLGSVIEHLNTLRITSSAKESAILRADNTEATGDDLVAIPKCLLEDLIAMLNAFSWNMTKTDLISEEWLTVYRDYHMAMYAGNEMNKKLNASRIDEKVLRLKDENNRLASNMREYLASNTHLVSQVLTLEKDLSDAQFRIEELKESTEKQYQQFKSAIDDLKLENTLYRELVMISDGLLLHKNLFNKLRIYVGDLTTFWDDNWCSTPLPPDLMGLLDTISAWRKDCECISSWEKLLGTYADKRCDPALEKRLPDTMHFYCGCYVQKLLDPNPSTLLLRSNSTLEDYDSDSTDVSPDEQVIDDDCHDDDLHDEGNDGCLLFPWDSICGDCGLSYCICSSTASASSSDEEPLVLKRKSSDEY